MSDLIKIAKQLRTAAGLIHSGHERYSCYAAERMIAGKAKFKEASEFYVNVMSARAVHESPWIYVNDFECYPDYTETHAMRRSRMTEAKEHRVMALLMASAVAEAGGQ